MPLENLLNSDIFDTLHNLTCKIDTSDSLILGTVFGLGLIVGSIAVYIAWKYSKSLEEVKEIQKEKEELYRVRFGRMPKY